MVVAPVVVPIIEIPHEFLAKFRPGFGALCALPLAYIGTIGSAVLAVFLALGTIVSLCLARIASAVGSLRSFALPVL